MAIGDTHFPESERLVHGPQRYLTAAGDTDQTTSFIDYDTDTGGVGPHTIDLRDADHAAGMHYHIRVTKSSSSNISVQRDSGSTKTISGWFEGFQSSAATSVTMTPTDGTLRLRPDGDNWAIY